MSGLQGYIYHKNNKITDANIVASVTPSSRLPLVYPKSKQGYGEVQIAGKYTGDTDGIFDIVISDNDISSPIVSLPSFKGSGVGTISGITVNSLSAQTIMVECVDTGIDGSSAYIDIQGLLFKSRGVGKLGNRINVTISNGNLLRTETTFILSEPLVAGTAASTNIAYDWDTQVLSGGIIPTSAHRLSFEQDPVNVYLQYKSLDNGVWTYYFVPSIKWEYRQGSKIYYVTGGRTVVITNGSRTETYPNIVTLADLWIAINDKSQLLEPVDTSLDIRRLPTSYAVKELSALTEAYVMPAYSQSGNSAYVTHVNSLSVNSQAVTEVVKATCIDNSILGRESWSVLGTVHGDMGNITTGEYFSTDDGVNFTIPKKVPEGYEDALQRFELDYSFSDDTITEEPIAVMGANVRPAKFTFVYTKRPSNSVSYDDFSSTCLGVTLPEGGEECVSCAITDPVYWVQMAERNLLNRHNYNVWYTHYKTFVTYLPTKRFNYVTLVSLANRIKVLFPVLDCSLIEDLFSDYKELYNSLKDITGITSTGNPAAITSRSVIEYYTWSSNRLAITRGGVNVDLYFDLLARVEALETEYFHTLKKKC